MSATAKLHGEATLEGGRRSLAPAAIACMGVVFGDIGTSPLYTLSVTVKSAGAGGQASPEAILGIVSLIFWSLILVISVKYAILIMRADNHGEGGILALLALVSPRRAKRNTWRAALVVVGLVGATLLYGDGTITPAISVLSAVEGLKLYAPQLGHAVVPATVVILAALFLIQRNGTSWIGGIFGPVMLIWFLLAAALGVAGIVKTPAVLAALSPLPAVAYLWHAGPLAFVVIGGAFLAVTGGEAFYADMGHFGPLPIRVAWFGVALPALTLNYFGQAGLLLADPSAIDNPFFQLAPQWAHYPLVALATVATVIASQSIISGAFSLTQQAINLGFLPRMNVVHTEGREIGQIYMPFVNWALAAGTLIAVIGFGSSDALAGAYGIAVSLLMAITTLMATFVALHWKVHPLVVYPVNFGLLALDLVFFASTSTKLLDGGWFPLLIAFVISFLMLTWRKGEEIMDTVRLEIRERTQTVRRAPSRLPAGPHPRHGHRPRPDGQGRAARAIPQCQMQSNAAGERAPCGGVDDRGAAGAGRKPDRGRADRRGDRARRAALRLHGGAQRPRGACGRHGARQDPEIRSRPGDLLYRPRDGHPLGTATGAPALARGDLRLHAPQRPAPRRLFQDPEQADHGDRDRVRDLSLGTAFCLVVCAAHPQPIASGRLKPDARRSRGGIVAKGCGRTRSAGKGPDHRNRRCYSYVPISWATRSSTAVEASGRPIVSARAQKPRVGDERPVMPRRQAVFSSVSASSSIIVLRIRNFCAFPLTVIGNESTKRTKRGAL